jgi:NADH:ubiquinone oxidoreductase subunit F (NADH-binding)
VSVPAPPTTLPRLLAGLPPSGAMSHARHLELHGGLPPLRRRRPDSPLALVNALERSGLQGRGGGAFPAATKMTAVAAARGRAIVVANGCEGEPVSVKDRLLLERLPHLVIDGALLAAHAVDASEVMIAADESATRAIHATDQALRERTDMHRGAPRVRLTPVPSGYVTGQERALLSFLNGGPPKPTGAPEPIFERGVKARPTLVSNVETLAHIALIARHGAAWFRELGDLDEPGSALVTVGGAVARPGVFEIEIGTPIATLIQAFLVGGYAGTWVQADIGSTLPLTVGGLPDGGPSLGAGAVYALPRSACPVAEVTAVAGWLSVNSAGQCGPCIHGLAAIATTLEQVRIGAGGHGALERIHRWASLASGRGACAHPDGAARFITSAIDVFGPELAHHARRGPCTVCMHRRLLPTPQPASTPRAA